MDKQGGLGYLQSVLFYAKSRVSILLFLFLILTFFIQPLLIISLINDNQENEIDENIVYGRQLVVTDDRENEINEDVRISSNYDDIVLDDEGKMNIYTNPDYPNFSFKYFNSWYLKIRE